MSHSAARPQVQHPEQMIGNYVIKETIGRGSFGKVKKGRHVHSGELVAIKILNRQKLKSAKMDKKIHREIEILQLFSHPNICRLYEVISTPTDMYLIMEYVEGGELYDYIVQKGRVRESEARYIFQQIVCALEYCHHFRVVHRDLKPENILLGSGMQVKLIDFGLSNIMKDGEFLATSCGSPNYAAPEVISGKLYFGPEVDVWSCGVILYALLCGCLPFDEDSIPVLFSKIKKGKYSIPPSMPAAPKELIHQILLVDPLVRLTIPQIRDNVWFNQRLPARLSFNESIFSAKDDRVISAIVTETAKRLGLRDREVRRQLEAGQGPGYVAYNILLDAKRRREIANEVHELGVFSEEGRSSGTFPGSSQTSFQPKAMERELNMGLMLTQSPAMEYLLDQGDATSNKTVYNTGTFVPASASNFNGASSDTGSEGCGGPGPLSVGSFRITSKVRSGSFGAGSSLPGSLVGGGGLRSSGSLRHRGLVETGSSVSQLGVTLLDQPRVGSVARKHAMYTAEEETFLLENNSGWRVGLMTDWKSNDMLQCVYNVLVAHGMEWKVISPFRLLVRTTPQTWAIISEAENRARAVQTSLSSTTTQSSAPIRIGGGARTMQDSNISDEEGEMVVGSTQRDDAVSHVASGGARLRRPGAGRTTAGSPTSRTEGSPLCAQSSAAYPVASESENEASMVMTAPGTQAVLNLFLFRIHERHDKGYLVDFNVVRNTMVALDIVLLLSDALVRKVGEERRTSYV